MKANEAPEKLYFSATENGTHYYTEGIPFEREYVEYIRTDAFVEKAEKWLGEYLMNTDFYEDEIELFVKEFKKAMRQ